MKRITVMKMVVFFFALTIILAGCSRKTTPQILTNSTIITSEEEPEASNPIENGVNIEIEESIDHQAKILEPYDNVFQLFHQNLSRNIFEQNEYKPEDIYTYTFEETTIFKGSETIASEVLERGKDPGLGIRDLHKQGITGKSVNVAIIDQNMLTDHPEFEDRIVAYFDSGCNQPENEGSYHGASVMGILAGKTIGIAPEVNVYYAAAPSWERDAKYYADCLNWIIQRNKELSKSEKIRVVSVSAAPTSEDNWFKNGELWEKAVLEAQKDGIMIIDCRPNKDTKFIFSSYYDIANQDNVTKCTPGYPDYEMDFTHEYWKKMLFAPASFRTLAQEFIKGEYCYRYQSVGGESWAVPYVSGVLALGWQVNPKLDPDTMKKLLFETSWVNDKGLHFINPPDFIEAVRKLS